MSDPAAPEMQQAARRDDPPSALPPAVAEFLIEFSVSLHRRAMYPAGHPFLQSAAERLLAKARAMLATEASVAFGVASDRLVQDGAVTDPRNSVFRELADKLHRHQLATLRISRGVSADEISRLVGLLSADPASYPRGGLLAAARGLEHVELQTINYGRIVLGEGEGATDPAIAGPRRSEDLWLDLARLTSGSQFTQESSNEQEPVALAQRIDGGASQDGYDREVFRRLTRLVEHLAASDQPADPALHARLSKLLAALQPGTLARLLKAGADDTERKRFVTAAVGALDTEAVMTVLEAVASASDQEMSHHLLRLLRKMAALGGTSPDRARAAAVSAVQINVDRLLENWRLEDPNPELYTAALDSMAESTAPQGNRDEACDPMIVLQAALEADASGPRTDVATDALLASGRLDELVGVLANSPGTSAADAIWQRVATPERLRLELQRGAVTSQSVAGIIERLGEHAVSPLLEILATTDDRAARAAALKFLASIGTPVVAPAVAMLQGAPWYLQRNLFVLLARVGSWPDELPTRPYLAHSDVRVRREAIKLVLESPVNRDAGLDAGLTDADEAIRNLALSAALEGCPGRLVSEVRRIAGDGKGGSESRTLAIRVLARSGEPEAVDTLVDIALARKFRFLYRRIASRSPEALAALTALAGQWRADPKAVEVLALARRHRDPEVRAAVLEAS